ncbi:MAG: LysR family transcriptional regulator, partial [Bacilli bacterium]
MDDLRNNIALCYDFYIVAKEKGYSKAANKYYVSQSSLSRNIANLEDRLKMVLINRNNKGIQLTSEGEKLYYELDQLFNNLSQFNFENDLKHSTDGLIKIGTTRNISDNKLLNYISTFNKMYPNIKIKIFTDNASNLNEYLKEHTIDVLIDYLPHINYSEKFEFEVKAISQFQTCFACSKDYFANEGKNIKSLKDLKEHKLIVPGSSRRRQLLDEVLQYNNVKLTPMIEMPDSKLMIDFVNENNYIGYFIEDEIKDSNLVKLNLNEKL